MNNHEMFRDLMDDPKFRDILEANASKAYIAEVDGIRIRHPWTHKSSWRTKGAARQAAREFVRVAIGDTFINKHRGGQFSNVPFSYSDLEDFTRTVEYEEWEKDHMEILKLNPGP